MGRHVTTHASLLVRLSGDADKVAWQEFCARYGELIRSFARRFGLQPADIDDVLQDVLAILTKSMPGFEYDPAKGKFRSYLKTLVVRAVHRKTFQKRSPELLGDYDQAIADDDGDTEAEAAWEHEWRHHHIRLAMQTIAVEFNEADCDAYQLYAVERLGANETADALGMNVDQVYKAKSRILRRLSELIAEQVEEEG